MFSNRSYMHRLGSGREKGRSVVLILHRYHTLVRLTEYAPVQNL